MGWGFDFDDVTDFVGDMSVADVATVATAGAAVYGVYAQTQAIQDQKDALNKQKAEMDAAGSITIATIDSPIIELGDTGFSEDDGSSNTGRISTPPKKDINQTKIKPSKPKGLI